MGKEVEEDSNAEGSIVKKVEREGNSFVVTLDLRSLQKQMERIAGNMDDRIAAAVNKYTEMHWQALAALQPFDRAMASAMESLQSSQSLIENALDRKLAGANALLSTVNSSVMTSLINAVESSSARLGPIMTQLQEFAKRQAENKEASEVLSEVGFLLSPSMTSELLDRVRVAAKEDPKVDIARIVIDFYRRENYSPLKEATLKWESNTLFSPRKEIIRDALQAHVEERYTLSVPALLPLIEGIANDFVVVEGLELNPKRSRDIKRALSHAPVTEMTSFEIYESLKGILDKIYSSIDFKSIHLESDSIVNRHVVLHGRQISYASEANSLRCFLVLDALASLLITDKTPQLEDIDDN